MSIRAITSWFVIFSAWLVGCSGSDSTGAVGGSSQTLGGAQSAGGQQGTAGSATTGGGVNGGSSAAAGAAAVGGTTQRASTAPTGGSQAAGGINAVGGANGTGGANGNGGTGGNSGTLGTQSTGGSTTAGGSRSTGGTVASGGNPSSGGSKAAGGSPSTGGALNTGGTTSAVCGNNPAPGTCAVTTALQAVPQLPRNACKNNSLPQAWGTNFPTPEDPAGWGDNTTAMGWEGNWWPPQAYLSGAFFARGVGTGTYKITFGKTAYVGTTVCGTMYSFGVATAGGTPAAASVKWAMDSGYLPAFTTSLSRSGVDISIKNFENKVTIGGHDFGLVYSRVTLKNNNTTFDNIGPSAIGGPRGAHEQFDHHWRRSERQPRLRRRGRRFWHWANPSHGHRAH